MFKTIYVPIWKLELIIAYDLHDSSNLLSNKNVQRSNKNRLIFTYSLVNIWFELEVIAKEFIFSFLRA